MDKDILKIVEHYGILTQLKYFQSEIYELNEAIITKEHAFPGMEEIDHIAEEIADVQVMLNQFKEYYYLDDKYIEKIMEQKVIRQLDRINKEK